MRERSDRSNLLAEIASSAFGLLAMTSENWTFAKWKSGGVFPSGDRQYFPACPLRAPAILQKSSEKQLYEVVYTLRSYAGLIPSLILEDQNRELFLKKMTFWADGIRGLGSPKMLAFRVRIL